jgi:hypothetical protein
VHVSASAVIVRKLCRYGTSELLLYLNPVCVSHQGLPAERSGACKQKFQACPLANETVAFGQIPPQPLPDSGLNIEQAKLGMSFDKVN